MKLIKRRIKLFWKVAFSLLIFALVFAAVSCANPQPPSGGPPDKTPPRVEETYPAQGATNFDGDEIRLVFNKYMNKTSVVADATISPEAKLDFDWSGKELTIEFKEPLKKNLTYCLTLGTNYTDYKGNKPLEAFSLFFSTGDKIDSGSVSGRIYGLDKDLGGSVYVFAYAIDSATASEFNPAKYAPDYKIQAGKNGKYTLKALKPAVYRTIAVDDKGRDGLYSPNADGFGTYSADVDLRKVSKVEGIDIYAGPPVDKTGPRLYCAEAVGGDVVKLCFSEKIDFSSLKRNSVAVYDSASGRERKVLSAFADLSDSSSAFILLENPLDTGKIYKIEALSDSAVAFKDLAGNSASDSANVVFFAGGSGEFKPKLKVVGVPFPDSAKNADEFGNFDFAFDYPVKRLGAGAFGIFDEKDSLVPFRSERICDNVFRISPERKLNPAARYKIEIDFGKIDFFKGKKSRDSIFALNFFTTDSRFFGGAKGGIVRWDSTQTDLIVRLISSSGKIYQSGIDAEGKWKIGNLPPGEYRLWTFADKNGDGEYDRGSLYPYRPAEPFAAATKKLEIKSRWTVEIDAPNPEKR